VDDAGAAGGVDGLRDGAAVPSGLSRRQWTVAQHRPQAAAFNEFHREVMLAFDLADIVDGDDVHVIQRRGGPGFPLEAFDGLLVGELAQQQHLEGDDPVEFDLPGLVNDPQAAVTEFR